MEKIQRFEDLHVYQQARHLINLIYKVTKEKEFQRDYGLRDQIRRASISVLSNIAEGFERGSKADFKRFLFIAKGSCGEIRAQLTIACDQKYISKETKEQLVGQSQLINGMLANLIKHLMKFSSKS
jgi:four helix bundle protein